MAPLWMVESGGMAAALQMRIAIGIIRKAHGIHGEASVEPWTDSPERFKEVREVTLVSPDESQTRQIQIETSRSHLGRALVKFAGIDAPEDLRDLRGWTIEIPRSDARKLDPDEYFLHDLVGLTLVDRDGKQYGEVKDAYEGGGGVLLTVAGPKGEFDVPFAAAICTEVDLAGKRIVVDLPKGIDDLTNVED
jgi:16S rRNA processing protein RimM